MAKRTKLLPFWTADLIRKKGESSESCRLTPRKRQKRKRAAATSSVKPLLQVCMVTGNYLGPAVIEQVRKIDPAAYLRVVQASCRDKSKLMCRLMCFTTPNQLWKLS